MAISTSREERQVETQGQVDFNSKVHDVLAQLTGGETFDPVPNVAGLTGGEARRRLCKRFAGRTTGSRVHLIRECVNAPKVKKLSDAMSVVERWETNLRMTC